MTLKTATMASSIKHQAYSCPLISIIVPVYNSSKYLQRCITSITSQTYTNLEIILVNDGSTDNSPQILDSWAKKDQRIRVIHKKNSGAGDSRNTGLDIANGTLIGIIDSDDFVATTMYEKLYSMMIDNNTEMSICRHKKIKDSDNDSEPNFNNGHEELEVITGREALYRLIRSTNAGSYNYLWNKLYRAELFDNVRFPIGNRHDDTARIHRLLGACKNIAISSEQLYFYRTHDESVMGRINRHEFNSDIHMKHFLDMYEAMQDRGDYLRSIGMNELAEFSDLRSKYYGVMTLMLQKLNYIRHKTEVINIVGCTPSALIMKLLFSKHNELRLRGIKLLFTLMKSPLL